MTDIADYGGETSERDIWLDAGLHLRTTRDYKRIDSNLRLHGSTIIKMDQLNRRLLDTGREPGDFAHLANSASLTDFTRHAWSFRVGDPVGGSMPPRIHYGRFSQVELGEVKTTVIFTDETDAMPNHGIWKRVYEGYAKPGAPVESERALGVVALFKLNGLLDGRIARADEALA